MPDLPKIETPDFADWIKWEMIADKERALHWGISNNKNRSPDIRILRCEPGNGDPETRIGIVYCYRFWDKRSISAEEMIVFGQAILRRWGFEREEKNKCVALCCDGVWRNITGQRSAFVLVFRNLKKERILKEFRIDVFGTDGAVICSARVRNPDVPENKQ